MTVEDSIGRNLGQTRRQLDKLPNRCGALRTDGGEYGHEDDKSYRKSDDRKVMYNHRHSPLLVKADDML